MRHMKKLSRYVLVCTSAGILLSPFGCSCFKQPPQNQMETVEVANPAPPVETAPSPAPITEDMLGKQARAEGALSTIYFEFDKFNILPSAATKLDLTAAWLKNHPEAKVVVEGHCDERGTNEYNIALGERRAKSAQQYLINLGIAPQRIATVSYGEERPVDSGHTENAWAKNRRDEFKLGSK